MAYPSPHAELIQFAVRLAEVSAAVIRRHFRGGFAVHHKTDDSLVTQADREAEEVMRDLIERHYPAHGILGEEHGLTRPEARERWVLDPIDGTSSFVAGSYLFGTLIAFCEDGQPRFGLLHQPLTDDLLVGDGRHTWLNGERVRVRGCRSIQDAVLLTSEHLDVHRYQDGPAFEALIRQVRHYYGWGNCHGYYLVATGGADVMLDPRMSPWDLMALVPIVRGAGGTVTDWQGNDPVLGTSLVATGGSIHDAVIRVLNPAR